MRNLLYRHVRKQIRQRSVWGSIVYFWWQASTNGAMALIRLDCWREIAFSLIDGQCIMKKRPRFRRSRL